MLRAHHSLATCVLFIGCAGTDTANDSDPVVGEDAGPVVDAGCKTCMRPRDAASDAWRPPPSDVCGNGIDDDGDGQIDEDCSCRQGQTQRCYRGDQSRAGVGVCAWGRQTCTVTLEGGEFQVSSWGACEGQADGSPHEICGDGLDNDCNGHVDEACPCREGTTEDCQTACGAGLRTCHDGMFGTCEPTQHHDEMCNGLDDDCDGVIDEELTRACSSACGSGVESCSAGRWAGCSAAAPQTESCNGVDDDCDGVVDDLTRPCSTACGSGIDSCQQGQWSCSARQPGVEQCNRVDDDCDGTIDDGLDANWNFINHCQSARVFLVIGGCNICGGSTCQGYWIDPGDTLTLQFEQNTTFRLSAIARKTSGDVCLNRQTIGGVTTTEQVHSVRNVDCFPEDYGLSVEGGC